MYSGSIVAIVTPMAESGAIDYEAWEVLLDWHVAEGTDGIVVCGTTGESSTVTLDEAAELTHRAAERLRGRIPLIAGEMNYPARRLAEVQAPWAVDPR